VTSFQVITVVAVLAHVGALLSARLAPWGSKGLLLLNAVVALAVLGYAATRLRYILAARDWPYAALIVLELAVLLGAGWAWRGSRSAMICSAIVFGLHGCVSIAAVLFAFVVKFNRLF
jgi:hypothetical protein